MGRAVCGAEPGRRSRRSTTPAANTWRAVRPDRPVARARCHTLVRRTETAHGGYSSTFLRYRSFEARGQGPEARATAESRVTSHESHGPCDSPSDGHTASLPVPGSGLWWLLRRRDWNPDAGGARIHGIHEHPPHEWPQELGRTVHQRNRCADIRVARPGRLARGDCDGERCDARRLRRVTTRAESAAGVRETRRNLYWIHCCWVAVRQLGSSRQEAGDEAGSREGTKRL